VTSGEVYLTLAEAVLHNVRPNFTNGWAESGAAGSQIELPTAFWFTCGGSMFDEERT
jgi:hypothetical protein